MKDLNKKLTEFREEEVEKRSRAAALAEKAKTEDLTSDDTAELDEIETRLKYISEQSTAIQRSLDIGVFSDDVNADIGLNEKEKRDFSVIRLIRALDPKASQKDKHEAALELEASAAVEQRLGVAPRGIYIPPEILGGEYRKKEQRDLTAGTSTQAGDLVGTDFRPQDFISLLRNNMALTTLGATYLDGLVGDVTIPRQTGGATAGWVATEGGTISESNQTVDQVTLSPKTLGVYTDYSRQLRLQSSISVENFVRNDLMTAVALAKDAAAFHGTGASGQPYGIDATAGIGSVTLAAAADPTRAEVIDLRTAVAVDNALVANMAYVCNSTFYGNMMAKAIDTGSGLFLINSDGAPLLGKPVVESNQINAGDLFYGNFADLLVGTWGGMDLMVDPYTGATAGTTRILIFHSCDIAVRHAQSFALADGGS